MFKKVSVHGPPRIDVLLNNISDSACSGQNAEIKKCIFWKQLQTFN